MPATRDVVQYQDVAEPIIWSARGGGGGWTTPPSAVGRHTVQYQSLAEPFEARTDIAAAGTLDALQVLPGLTLDYQALTQPLAVPPAVAPFVPTGVAAYLSIYPDPVRTRRLPEMGTPYVFLLPLQVSGSALSWVPVYYGRPGLAPSLHPFSQVLNPPFVTSLTVATWFSAYFPDRVPGPPSGFPATLDALTWTVINITPPPPPTFTRNPFPNLYRRWFLYDMRRP